MSPNEQKMTPGCAAMAWALSIISSDVTQTGTTRAMDKFDLLRQQMIQAVLDDAVGLAAANFHQHPGLGDRPPDFVDDFFGKRLIAIFIEIFHGEPPDGAVSFISNSGVSNSPNCFISSRA